MTKEVKMSEQSLDKTIRALRSARESLAMAIALSDTLLSDHNISSEILGLELDVKNMITKLDNDYRQSHYPKRRRR